MQDYDMLLQRLEEQGWAVADGFMPPGMTAQLYHAAFDAWQHGRFRDAHVGAPQTELRDTAIRGDTIFWLDDDTDNVAGRDFLDWANGLQQVLNRHFFLGLKRHEFHFARYDTGYGYKTHIDQHRGHPYRQITLILYLNPEWDDHDGGELCIYSPDDDTAEMHRVLPQHDRLVLFRSGLIPHAVLPCWRPRWSLTGWFRNDAF